MCHTSTLFLVARWTSTEAFTHILVAWVRELKEKMGCDVKEVADQIWIKYLSQAGLAFCHDPGLGENPCHRDVWLALGGNNKVHISLQLFLDFIKTCRSTRFGVKLRSITSPERE